MPRRDHGDPLTKLIPQPGRQLVFKQDGTISGQVTFKCNGAVAFSLRPKIGAPHPDFTACQCYNALVSKTENGIAEIVCDYLGIQSNPTPPQVEFVGGTAEEAIETHHDFVSKIGGRRGVALNGATFDAETGEFLGFPPEAPNNLGGTRGYLAPGSTVRVTFYTTSASWGLYDLGHIASPPGNVPRPPGSRNWLKVNWSRRDYGLIYQITEEYLASGKRGWNPLIYG